MTDPHHNTIEVFRPIIYVINRSPLGKLNVHLETNWFVQIDQDGARIAEFDESHYMLEDGTELFKTFFTEQEWEDIEVLCATSLDLSEPLDDPEAELAEWVDLQIDMMQEDRLFD